MSFSGAVSCHLDGFDLKVVFTSFVGSNKNGVSFLFSALVCSFLKLVHEFGLQISCHCPCNGLGV
jgi:hypothetical protein